MFLSALAWNCVLIKPSISLSGRKIIKSSSAASFTRVRRANRTPRPARVWPANRPRDVRAQGGNVAKVNVTGDTARPYRARTEIRSIILAGHPYTVRPAQRLSTCPYLSILKLFFFSERKSEIPKPVHQNIKT